MSEPEHKLRIISADDNPMDQMLISRFLENMGHDVELVSNGTRLIDSIERNQYDLALVDAHMPGVMGIEAVEHIRGLEEDGSRVYIVGLTAYDEKVCEDKFKEAGVDEYCPKPLEYSQLMDIVRRCSGQVTAG